MGKLVKLCANTWIDPENVMRVSLHSCIAHNAIHVYLQDGGRMEIIIAGGGDSTPEMLEELDVVAERINDGRLPKMHVTK